jgi:superfamily II DNA/RNA helicase
MWIVSLMQGMQICDESRIRPCRIDPNLHHPQALCMCPTRELVVQNLEVLRKLAVHTTVTSIGTSEIQAGRIPQISQQVVIGTAGKLKSLVASRALPLDDMKVLVFDEADVMLDVDGFMVRSAFTSRMSRPNRCLQNLSQKPHSRCLSRGPKACGRQFIVLCCS